MKIYDMHIHADSGEPSSARLMEKMDEAGVYGGAVFSMFPEECRDFNKRYENVMKWTEGYNGRLFPIMFVHPYEDDIVKKCVESTEQGIAGFKMICSDYNVYDERSLELLRAIAETGKPVLFHSGILWTGTASSVYNRPANWESLIDIPALRFSLAHCSWPWIDECIAVYGKILNSYTTGAGKSEMFFDVTPGTPVIYRKELWYKLFNVGYDVPHNIMWGTDCSTSTYKVSWVKGWIERDNAIFDELNAGGRIRELIFEKNFLRFIGVDKQVVKHMSPVPDAAASWTLSDLDD